MKFLVQKNSLRSNCRLKLSAFLGLVTVFTIACDPVAYIKNDIPESDTGNEFACVAQALQQVPEVKMLSQEKVPPSSNCTKASCIKAQRITTYQILGTEKYKVGEVITIDYFGKKSETLNQIKVAFPTLSTKDRMLVERVLKVVSEKVSATCAR